jgi:excisionase family DNA binding protein
MVIKYMNLVNTVVSTSEAANVLGIHSLSIQKLIYSGALTAEKIANRWLIQKDELAEFAKTYNPNRGRPRTKRKYTKRCPIWNAS